MTRFFMTIPEAATLVLQAGAMAGQQGRAGEVFVLDMGAPIAILGLAKRFVRACGYEPVTGLDAGSPGRIPIVLSGARPGEKLHEQLSYDAEELCTTAHPGIWRLDSETPPNADAVDTMMADLDTVRQMGSRRVVLDAIGRHVPTMAPGMTPIIAA
jgi:FlaA1/EpsC-like NDP-sugar epimerase